MCFSVINPFRRDFVYLIYIRKKKMKKSLFIVAALLCAVLVLGCGPRGTQAARGPSQMDGRVKGTLPLSDGSVTFSVFLGGLDNFVTSFEYEDNLTTRMFTDETGINFNFVASSRTDATTRANVLLSSGDHPEIMIPSGFPRTFMTYYAAEGLLAPMELAHVLEWPRIRALIEQYPFIVDVITWSDGTVRGLPNVNDCTHCVDDAGRMFFYMPWLRENNIPEPTTMAELISYLRFVRDNDMNRNGNRNDEVPWAWISTMQQRAIAVFANMHMPFIVTRAGTFGLAMENGRLVEQYKDPRFRETLRVMNQLYNEGLIIPENFTMNNEQIIALVEGRDPLVATVTTGHIMSVTYGTGQRRVDFNLGQVVSGPGGRYGSNIEPWSVANVNYFITDKCQDVDLAIAFHDYLLRMESTLAAYVGVKGDGWDDPDPGALGINGQPALYKYLVLWRGPDHRVNMGWNQIGNKGQTTQFRLGEQALGFDIVREWMATGNPALRDTILANPSYFETHNHISLEHRMPYWKSVDFFIPIINFNDADNTRLADINASLNAFVDQACAQYIIGTRNINSDADWNQFIQELDRQGALDRVAIYNRYLQ